MILSLILKEKSLIEELYEYFYEKYFSVDMPYFENFKVQSNALFSLRTVIIGITIGIIIASASSVYNKRHLGAFIRTMIEKGCLGPENAMTLEALGYDKKLGIAMTVKSGGTLSRWARCREEDEFYESIALKKAEFEEAHASEKKPPKFVEPEFKRDYKTMHFYLPEEKKYAAEIKFDPKGSRWGGVVIVAIFAIALCAFLCYILPDAVKLVDNFITVMNK